MSVPEDTRAESLGQDPIAAAFPEKQRKMPTEGLPRACSWGRQRAGEACVQEAVSDLEILSN